jgi:predicted RNA-binding Zn ribbon-like protein
VRTAGLALFLVTYPPDSARLLDWLIPVLIQMDDARPAPIFIGDAPALDFLNSIASPVDTPVEWLTSGTDLLDWLAVAKLAPPAVMTSMRRTALPGELDAVAAQARALREWFRGFVHQYKGKPLKAEALKDLAPLNRILERDQEFGQIVKRDPPRDPAVRSGVAWRQMRRWQTPDTLLLPVAKTMAELICNEDFSNIKACEGPVCTLLFLDRSHMRGRRWCSMAMCGNRAKQAAHRKRGRH